MSDFVVGLTGGIGSGKTAVSDRFAQLGIDVVDADVCARQVVQKGSHALASIRQRFGNAMLQPDGTLDRAALRQVIFTQPEQKKWLNELLHPLIREQMMQDIATATSAYCVLSVPLLLENKLNTLVHRVLVVDVPETTQIARVTRRDGSDESLVKSIMDAQMSRAERLAAADDVIDNSLPLESLDQRVSELHQTYLTLSQASSL
ncbi:dephospho-CoA kinase [Alteromonas oceanisediminis]|uniref:dephospho-CoA kinase n=1 Tax=Alteromonas oceanisediminis TaxID=2836180 RepID=UPI001BD91393|nr:dephospho-CoA kinase [Alteromonas oceanisediminis]MBT0585539.1 dephospho-CoA kinase [Alteromonas oceanisediminis]